MTPTEELKLLAQLDMRKALMVSHSFFHKVEHDGGIAAVLADLQREYPGVEFTPESVKHAMSCGGSIILMMVMSMVKRAMDGEAVTPTDLKSEAEAERATNEILSRIRKLH